MTTATDLILQAYRDCNIVPVGLPLTDRQAAEGLLLLNQVVLGLCNSDAGVLYRDVDVPRPERHHWSDGHLVRRRRSGRNIRLVLASADGVARKVTLSAHPDNGAFLTVADPLVSLASTPLTISANGRAIAGQAEITLTDATDPPVWLYRADLANWLPVTPLELTDQFPFTRDFDPYYVILLAMRLNPRYGRSLDPQSQTTLNQYRQNFVNAHLQRDRLAIDEALSFPNMSFQSWNVATGLWEPGHSLTGDPT
jgi:hypothetical protein